MQHSSVSRRRWLSGVGASAAATVLAAPSASAQAATTSGSGANDAEIVVIGGGYAGLACARALAAAGRDVVLLEARERAGGRCLNQALPAPYNQFNIEAGAAYLGPTQTRMHALVQSFGLQTYRTYNTGKLVSYKTGRRSTYSGVIPTANLFAAGEAGLAMLQLDAYAKQIDANAPWLHRRANEWDQQSIQNWMDRNLISNDGKNLLRLAVLSLLSCEPRDASLLFFLLYIRTAGDLTTLLATENGAQQDRVVGGTQRIALAMADSLGERVVYQAPVRTVEQDAQGVTVCGDDFTVRAQYAVMAMAPAMAGRVAYKGVLDGAMQQRLQLMQRVPMGTIWKTQCVYDRPFWRDDGLNGQVTSDNFITKVTFDNTPHGAGAPGVLMGFIDGQDAIDACTMTPAERQRKVVEAMTAYFGAKAANPVAYLEQNWQAENFSAGGPTGYTGPGVLTSLGPALRRPAGRLHWAGTETATEWLGYMEGAVRSGERAAQEILAR